MNTSHDRTQILGYQVAATSISVLVERIAQDILAGKKKCSLACLNPHSFVVAEDDPEFKSALQTCTWLTPDGAGLVLAARLLKVPIKERIAGPDVFLELHRQTEKIGGCRVFLLGSTEMNLKLITHRFSKDFPRSSITGTWSPPFKTEFTVEDIGVMAQKINEAKPDILWIALTAPKQEKLMQKLLPQIEVGFVGAVGAAFDFYAGTVKRSPAIFRKTGLEWLPRLLQEPRRLWRRTFVSLPVFLRHVAIAFLKRRQA